MSKRLNIAFYLFCILMLTGCEQNTLSVTSPTFEGEERSEILLNASLVQAEVMPTRNTDFITTDNLTGVTFGVYASSNASDLTLNNRYFNTAVPFKINEAGVLKSSSTSSIPGISPTGNIIMPGDADFLKIFAFAPFDENVLDEDTEQPKVAVKSGLCTDFTKPFITDPIWATVMVNNYLDVTMQFIHTMARLNILIETTHEYQNYTVKDITLTLDRVQQGYMNLTSGNINSSEETATAYNTDYSMQPPTLAMANDPEHPLFAHTLLPYSVIQKLTLTLLSPEGEEIPVTAYDSENGVNAQLADQMTMNRGKAKTFVIRYKTENSPATRSASQLEEHGETVIIDYLP